jgi:hypothetical protein
MRPAYRPSGVVLHSAPSGNADLALCAVDPQDAALIRASQVAWQRERSSAWMSVENWRDVGERVIRGAAKASFGGGFNKLMGVWLRQNGFDVIDAVTRHAAWRLARKWAGVSGTQAFRGCDVSQVMTL